VQIEFVPEFEGLFEATLQLIFAKTHNRSDLRFLQSYRLLLVHSRIMNVSNLSINVGMSEVVREIVGDKMGEIDEYYQRKLYPSQS
jgi:hypothetical protein